MPKGVWARHPLYTLLLSLVLIATLFLLIPRKYTGPIVEYDMHGDYSLKNRIKRSNWMYDRQINQRPWLIHKFGPDAKGLPLFPADKRPWPAYTVWSFFPAAFHCPHEVERLGSLGDGGKFVCGLDRVKSKEDCVVYSFGINYESSFEAAILENTQNCRIWGYDFSVKSFGQEISSEQQERTHFAPYGLSGSDNHDEEDKVKMYTLETLMKMNNHRHIDILKIDIEGWEFEALTSFLRPYIASGKPLPFGQLQLEIHLWDKPLDEVMGWWENLERAGLRPFRAEPNLVYANYNKKTKPQLAEYSFLNIKGDNVFITD